jgi:CHAT domain-containing protein/Tfp pilus assembly protein PilF
MSRPIQQRECVLRLVLRGLAVFLLLQFVSEFSLDRAGAETLSEENLNQSIARLYRNGRYVEAIPLAENNLAAIRTTYGESSLQYATAANDLAQLLQAVGRNVEAELLLHQALSVYELRTGPESRFVATVLNNLGQLLHATGRNRQAEPLLRRALSVTQATLPDNHPNIALRHSNLAVVLKDEGHLTESESHYHTALSIDEKSSGSNSIEVARDLNNLGELTQLQGRFAEAEAFFRHALLIYERRLGSDHPSVAVVSNNIAGILSETNRFDEAENAIRHSLDLTKARLGPDHPLVAERATNLGLILAEQGAWGDARAIYRQTNPILTKHLADLSAVGSSAGRADLKRNSGAFRAQAQSIYHDVRNTESFVEAFEAAQWAIQADAAAAVAQMASRFAHDDKSLGELARTRQDLVNKRDGEYRYLLRMIGGGDNGTATRQAIEHLDSDIKLIDVRLANEFPDYWRLANPTPLSLNETQALLRSDEALVVILDVPQLGRLPGETLIFLVTKDADKWLGIPFDTRILTDRVAEIRCGLDRSGWFDPAPSADEEYNAAPRARRPICHGELGHDSGQEFLPFDLERAHALYVTLFGQLEDLIKDKRLIVVPTGPLANLPLQVLVTKKPDPGFGGLEAYRKASWFGIEQTLSILPSVPSLKALRHDVRASAADQPFIGFGNPLLEGSPNNPDDQERAKIALEWQRCSAIHRPSLIDTNDRRGFFNGETGDSLFRGPYFNMRTIRLQSPLPETAQEVCAIARTLGVAASDLDQAVYLGGRATKSTIKALNEAHTLEHFRIVEFATHGVLAGQWRGLSEPGLILTPPSSAEDVEALKQDDGYLGVADIAEFKLDADWVVLSACNTGAGEADDEEPFSGLARAFFYAGARAILVSHWAVTTTAAVKLTTRAFEALQADPVIGRAEALRRSMKAAIRDRTWPGAAHPAVWAPFVLIGEGAQ